MTSQKTNEGKCLTQFGRRGGGTEIIIITKFLRDEILSKLQFRKAYP